MYGDFIIFLAWVASVTLAMENSYLILVTPNWSQSRNINEAAEWWGKRLTTPASFVPDFLLSLGNTFYVGYIII